MDRNSLIGFVLIGLILFTYIKVTQPSEEEMQEIRKEQMRQDSMSRIEQANSQITAVSNAPSVDISTADSTNAILLQQQYGSFHQKLHGEEAFHTLENDFIKLTFSSKGGRVVSAELKDFKRYNKEPVILFKEQDANFSLVLTANSRIVKSSELYFEVTATSKHKITFSLPHADGTSIDFIYQLQADGYSLDFTISGDGLAQAFSPNSTTADLLWSLKMPQLEKGRSFEQQYSGLYYKYANDSDVKDLDASGQDDENLNGKVQWISFKDQFFSTIIVAKQSFQSGSVNSVELESSTDYLKQLDANMIAPFRPGVQTELAYTYHFVPNKLELLQSYADLELDQLVPLGWGIFGWINKYIIIKVFNFLEKYISNYGIIILLLTIIIKILLTPLTYKSYLSTAKMRLLKPQIDEATKNIPQDQPMERQKATMAIYSKAGVSPMGGCLPTLVQMPFLFAMFRFFPSAIELRQKSFLWADDLSSYDDFFSWSESIPVLGNHLSLFCLLMAATNLIYSRMNSQMTASTASMPMMKYMMYFMPLIMIIFLNNYASGLSYYYFLSTFITIIQTVLMRYMINDEKLLSKLQTNKKKKPKKKSGFLARLEEAQRRQQQELKKRQKKQK